MISVKQNDRRPAAPATIRRGDDIVDLTLATSVTFKMRYTHRPEKLVDAAATFVDRVNGEVEYRWVEGDTAKAGTFFAEWQVIWSDGTPETFPTFGYDVVLIWPDLDGS